MKIYLCGPIAGCSDDECVNWREEIKREFGALLCIDPMRRDYRGRESGNEREIVELDKLDVLQSDIVLVNAMRVSVGTSMEVLYAWMHHKTIITIAPDRISPWLAYHSTMVVGTLDAAAAEIWGIINERDRA